MGLRFKELHLSPRVLFSSTPGHSSRKRPETFLVSLSSLIPLCWWLTQACHGCAVQQQLAQALTGISTGSKGTNTAVSQGTRPWRVPLLEWEGNVFKCCRFIPAWSKWHFTLAYTLRCFLYLEKEAYSASLWQAPASLQEPTNFFLLMHRAYRNCLMLLSWLCNSVPSRNKRMPGWQLSLHYIWYLSIACSGQNPFRWGMQWNQCINLMKEFFAGISVIHCTLSSDRKNKYFHLLFSTFSKWGMAELHYISTLFWREQRGDTEGEWDMMRLTDNELLCSDMDLSSFLLPPTGIR